MDFKRRLAIAACTPNVSVWNLALEHEVNANMVFKWRRQYRAGLLGADVETTFLPVAVKDRGRLQATLATLSRKSDMAAAVR